MPAPIFIVAVSLHIAAIIFFVRKWHKASLLTLFSGAFILRYYVITVDRFLHEWDERFHALVAKNLMHHWLRPTLYDQPLLAYDYKSWYNNSVWLHKQPLFLWQMALSMKIFGVNEVALRLPTLVLGSLMVLVVYGIGKIAFNRQTGFIGAVIISCYEPILELSSGFGNTDHNDVVFIFYVTLATYLWLCFEKTKSSKYLWLMGLCSGLAILTKWMTGLIVFGAFGFYHLIMTRDLFSKEIIKQGAISLLICILTFLPWQLYILYHYPVEARYEYYYNNLHFTKVLEGKYADSAWWFYFFRLKDQYYGAEYLIAVGFVICALYWRRYRYAIAMAAMTVAVYTFFSIAATKMQSFVLMVAPVNILFISFAADRMLNTLRKYKLIRQIASIATMAGLMYLFLDYGAFDYLHIATYGWTSGYKEPEMANMRLYKKAKKQLPQNAVIIGFEEWRSVSGMFYSDRICYPDISKKDLQKIQEMGRPVYYMGDSIPDYASRAGVQLLKDAIDIHTH